MFGPMTVVFIAGCLIMSYLLVGFSIGVRGVAMTLRHPDAAKLMHSHQLTLGQMLGITMLLWLPMMVTISRLHRSRRNERGSGTLEQNAEAWDFIARARNNKPDDPEVPHDK